MSEEKSCRINDDCSPGRIVRDLCPKHYRRWKRGTLGRPRYWRPRGAVGMTTEWPFEVKQIDGEWHRRPTGSCEPWAPVVWAEDAAAVRPRGLL